MEAVARKWKRDGTRNLMTIEMASLNIASNGILRGGEKAEIKKDEAVKLLKAGKTLETVHAAFTMVDV